MTTTGLATEPTTYAEPTTEAERVAFWERQASRLDWAAPWHTAHTFERPQRIGTRADGTPDFTVPRIEWFAGGALNAAHNCVDRHVAAGSGDKPALLFEGEPGDRRTLTYADLQEEVSRAANALISLGVEAGDRVVIYLPVIPETVVITLACARIGAVHSLVFGGFSAEALQFRVEDTGAKVLVTSDGQFRRGKAVPVKDAADEAVSGDNDIEHVLVVRRTGDDIAWTDGRDVWWHDALADASPDHEAQPFDAEHPLFIIYTSGTTGRPKGLVHTTGGYLTQTAYTHALLFDLVDGELDTVNDPQKVADAVHWCTADLAWVTAHTYEIYGPLLNGVTQVIYEGTPQEPHAGRHFEIIERYGVTTYYTAPTLVRSHMGAFGSHPAPGERPADRWDLSSVRLVGTVGESVNPEAWSWLRREVGSGTAPVIDTWWQSETGSCVMSPRPQDGCWQPAGASGADPATAAEAPKPGCATRALPGLSAVVVDTDGSPTPTGEQGLLVVDGIGPSAARTVWNEPQRFLDSYWAHFGERGWFLSGDGARRDADGDITVLGRVDDVINISGHRLSTIEIESALVSHPWVVEAGAAPTTDPLTGHAVLSFVVLAQEARDVSADDLRDTLRAHVSQRIGPIAKPAHVIAVPEVPKTRSGKIMRRLLTQLFEHTTLGDTTSLMNAHAVDDIARIVEHPAAEAATTL
ncbi:acetyl-CoA synthetase [Brevibacterium sp. Mu109]|uniref:acetate--CoA ligase n=1 Tax=Brevibacterium sp. Mu109 TaxID=1255669 RepID=UPI000C6BEEAC|nr:acetate--CoA ligase [Brevibacterium sp. Mu109]SMX94871.1 acetyl-CoA synthetase [Brevibacterium sp. Mu109]